MNAVFSNLAGKVFTAVTLVVLSSVLFCSCGNAEEEAREKAATDSITHAQQQQIKDSIDRAQVKIKSVDSGTSTDIPVIDSAGMMDALHAIDSIAKLKEK